MSENSTPDKAEPAGRRLSVAGAIRSGMVWNALNFLGSQVAGFAVFIVLANRLSPEIFGVVAIAAIIADVVANDGRFACADAIVQADRYDKTSLNSAFLAFSTVALVLAGAMWIAGDYVAHAYHAPLLAVFLPCFAAMLVFTPWLAITDAIILRDLGFRQLTQRNILGTTIGGLAGVAVAFSPWFIWALAVQRLVTLIVTGGFVYHLTRWLPGWNVRGDRIADFYRRFFPIWTISSLNQAGTRVSTLLFGIRYDANTVGLLRAANRLGESVQGPLVSPMMGLWFPLMAKVRGNPAGERQVHNAILRTAAFLALPAFAGLTVVADDVVDVLLPVRYAGVAPLMQAVCAVSLLIPLAWFTPIGMTSLAMNKTSLVYCLIHVAACLAALFAFPHVTAAQAVLVMSCPTIVIAVAGNWIINRRLGQSNRHHYAGLAPAVLATLAMTAATLGAQFALSWAGPWVRLFACLAAGIVVYGGWLFVFHRRWLMQRIALLRGRDATQDTSEA